MLLRLTKPSQVAACLAAFSWPTGNDVENVVQALRACVVWLNKSHVIAVTNAVRARFLRQSLDILCGMDSNIDWKSFGCQTGMALLSGLDAHAPIFPIEMVNDMPSVAKSYCQICAAVFATLAFEIPD